MQSPQFDETWNTSLQDEEPSAGNQEGMNLVGQQLQQAKNKDPVDLVTEIQNSLKNSFNLKILTILIIGVLLMWIVFGNTSNQKIVHETRQINAITNSLDVSDINKNFQDQTQNDDTDDSFDLNFVQTQYQGKQTEEMLAKAAFADMEKKFNIAHLYGEGSQAEQKQKKKLLEDISTLEIMIPDQSLSDYVAQNFFFFSVSIHDMILNSDLDKLYRNGQTIYKISLKQHMRAIIRTQLVHNVNFKGQVEVALSPFDKSLEQKVKAIKQIMQDEEIYYESFYELSKYNKYQLRFCIVVPSYKNVKSRLYLRNLDSIFMQDYQNYHVVYIDDASPDKTGDYVLKYINQKQIPSDKIQVYINDVNKKAMYNIYNGIHSYCPDGEVVGLIDGDDSFLGRKVFQLYNAIYQSKRTALVYSNFLKILTNNKTSFGFGTQMTKQDFDSGKLRNDMSLVGTHFMSFFSDLFKQIKKEDLCYENGTFYDYAYDRAIITPMIELAFPRVHYLAEITYEYRNDTGINDGTQNWERVSRIILGQPPYDQIKSFSFIDDFVDETERKIKEEEQAALKQKGLLDNKINLPDSFFKDVDQTQGNKQSQGLQIQQK